MRKQLKQFLAVTLIAVVVLTTTSCQQPTRERTAAQQQKTDEETPLVVFYSNSKYQYVISDFQKKHPEIPIEAYGINYEVTEEERASGVIIDEMAKTIKEYGNPDIVLGDELTKYIKKGYIADIQPFLAKDASYKTEQYFSGTDQVGRYQNGIYMLPLSITVSCLTMSQKQWENSRLHSLSEEFTLKELLNAMEYEINQSSQNGKYGFALDHDIGAYDYGLLWRTAVLEIDENGKASIDTDLFNSICHVLQAKRFCEVANPLELGDGIIALGNDENQFLGFWWSNTPYVNISGGYNTNVQILGEENTHIIWIPTRYGKDTYAAIPNICMAVGSESTNQERAYNVIRMFMDAPWDIWNLGVTNQRYNSLNVFPVNKERAREQISNVESLEKLEFQFEVNRTSTRAIKSIKKDKLPEGKLEELEYLMDHISMMCMMEEQPLVMNILEPFMKNPQIQDFDAAGQEIVDIINQQSQNPNGE